MLTEPEELPEKLFIKLTNNFTATQVKTLLSWSLLCKYWLQPSRDVFHQCYIT